MRLLIPLLIACGGADGGGAGFGTASAASGALIPSIDGADRQRSQVAVRWEAVVSDVAQVTDIQVAPPQPTGTGARPLLVAMKGGTAVRISGTSRDEVLDLPVATASEQGLLGLVYDPDFWSNGHLWAYYTVPGKAGGTSRISRFTVDPASTNWTGRDEQVVLEVGQPWANHNGGQLLFGADGMLYIGLGDGGSGGDPKGAGQDRGTLLGKVLRIDVRSAAPYAVPADNPFVGQAGVRPEIWAWGLRNPWRFTSLADGRLVVADVGQNDWEEVDLVEAGVNLGWNRREGRSCFEPERDCATADMVDPIYVYGRDEGQSITGGLVYAGAAVPALRGRYVFGDFASGRVWAIDVPAQAPAAASNATPAVATALGRIKANISTFGVDADGELLLGDYSGGIIYRLVAP
jgi:glucose/arabinose dehydrogenase